MDGTARRARRLFLALEIPEEVASGLVSLQGGCQGARWSRKETLHLTLRFLGDVDDEGCARLRLGLEALAFEPFRLRIERAGTFTLRDQAVLWMGPAPSAALADLHGLVDGILATALGVPCERAYTPHVTLGRLRHPRRDATRAFAERAAREAGRMHLEFTVATVTLFNSHLGAGGAQHTVLGRYGATWRNH